MPSRVPAARSPARDTFRSGLRGRHGIQLRSAETAPVRPRAHRTRTHMSTWLITGGAGFIGSNFVRQLAAAPPARLVVLDALTYAGNLATIADLIDGTQVRFVHADIRDVAAVREVFARHDV